MQFVPFCWTRLRGLLANPHTVQSNLNPASFKTQAKNRLSVCATPTGVMSLLESTIHNLESIKYNLHNQELLIKALKCLRDTVGNATLKDQVVNHVNTLLMYRDTHCHNRTNLSDAEIADMPKLHTIIYGSPGFSWQRFSPAYGLLLGW